MPDTPEIIIHDPVRVRVADLKPHPRNYRKHPEDQLRHLAVSFKKHGVYANVVCAKDLTLLKGHGVNEAAAMAGIPEINAVVKGIDRDSPEALEILAGDNEVSRLAEVDDRALSLILKEIRDSASESAAEALLGTGFDDMMLANLLMVTRPAGEIADLNEAAEWVGMPDFQPTPRGINLVINFNSEEDRQKLIDQLGLFISRKWHATWSGNWPPEARHDAKSLKFVTGDTDGTDDEVPVAADG